ncbi:MAG: HAMP domain-containing sensor histidine kinase [Burkholderiaceae bacterium]
MLSIPRDSLLTISRYLSARRDVIVADWCARVVNDPKLTAGASLSRDRLQDHIPAMLEDFERRLAALASPADGTGHDAAAAGDATVHGLHRWQEGFELVEVTRELGRLNQCVVDELERCAQTQASLDPSALAEARRAWAEMYGVVLYESTAEFFKLQQIEARGHVTDLEQSLASLRELEQQRAVLWQQAAHDLRGNLGGVVLATAGLGSAASSDAVRQRLLGALDRNVRALHRMLEDVTGLARLQSGQEQRSVAALDVSALLNDLGESLQPLAGERHLALDFGGPPAFTVVGDAIKVQRIVQNLVLNALRYTRQGGVTVRWGTPAAEDSKQWFVEVRDTGPGFDGGSGAALTGAIGVATEVGKTSGAAHAQNVLPHFEISKFATDQTTPAPDGHPGEGIGLSIVKRLCTLLDATIEFESSAGRGTTFRVLLPKDYPG